ncbi:CotH kinase family protein [Ruminococcus sp.]|uniref:CotH kinase family protein n=1 Tax=Ruminococcus sp. TaxID=41978 RepID=UPI00388E65F3
MKRVLSLLLLFALLSALLCLPASAASTDAPPVAKIEITTDQGNGTALLKADGYVGAHITITDTDGSVTDDAISLKVRGNSTAIDSIPKKGFNFKFAQKTEVLGMGKGKKWALLANCFDPTLLRNYLTFDLARELKLPYTSEQRFAELWLDGAYRGCYTVYEPVQEGSDRVDIDIKSNDGKKDFLLEYEASRTEDDVTYLSVGGLRFAMADPDEPSEEQVAYTTAVMTDVINTIWNGTEQQIREKIDVDSFAAYYLLNEFVKTADFGLSSVFFFYKDGVLYAGPPWDYDLSMGNLNADLNSASAKEASRTDGIMQSDKNLYRWLYNKEWFRNEIKRVYAQHYPAFADIGADGGRLDALRSEHQALFDRNFGVWSVGRWWLNYQKVPYKTYDENYRFLKTWCADRNSWLTTHWGLYRYEYLLGDADGSGEVDIVDATTIQRVLSDLQEDNDGRIALRGTLTGEALAITDASAIQRYTALMGIEYPIDEPRAAMLFD